MLQRDRNYTLLSLSYSFMSLYENKEKQIIRKNTTVHIRFFHLVGTDLR